MLIERQLGSRIFADDEWGDFIIYSAYPKRQVFVDGRSDFYGGPFDEKFIDVLNAKYGWEEHLKSYKVDAVLLSTTSPLSGAMKESRNWQPIYDDTMAIVFTPVSKGDDRRDATNGMKLVDRGLTARAENTFATAGGKSE